MVKTRKEAMEERNRLLPVGFFELTLGGVRSYLEQIVIFSASKKNQLRGTTKEKWLTFL